MSTVLLKDNNIKIYNKYIILYYVHNYKYIFYYKEHNKTGGPHSTALAGQRADTARLKQRRAGGSQHTA